MKFEVQLAQLAKMVETQQLKLAGQQSELEQLQLEEKAAEARVFEQLARTMQSKSQVAQLQHSLADQKHATVSMATRMVKEKQELMRLQHREAFISEQLERREADLLQETAMVRQRLDLLVSSETPRGRLEVRITQLQQGSECAEELIAQLQLELSHFSGAKRVNELQQLQQLADAREIASNRRNQDLTVEIARVEREIEAIAASELFKARISLQKQMREQCKQLQQKIQELDRKH